MMFARMSPHSGRDTLDVNLKAGSLCGWPSGGLRDARIVGCIGEFGNPSATSQEEVVMHVASILNSKGREVETAPLDTSLMEVTQRLANKRIGAIVVVSNRDDSVVGIISERDIIRVIGTEGTAALSRPLAEVMTRNVVTCRESDTTDQLMRLMTTRRFRHLPVMEHGKLVGIVSIGDVVKFRVAEVEFEATAMRDYITAS
jgi:CBS domain-containing protein